MNTNLNLITRTWLLMAETRDLKMGPQPIIRSPFEFCFVGWGRDVITITSLGRRMATWPKDLARLAARTSANGGHSNGRLT